MNQERGPRSLGLTVVLDRADLGGAEMVLLHLVRTLDRARVAPRLVCLRRAGELADDFRDAGCPVEVLRRRGRFDLSTFPRLVTTLRGTPTDVVLVMHHQRATLVLGRLAARLVGAADVLAVHGMDLVAQGQRALPRHVVRTLFLTRALVLLAPSQAAYLHDVEGVGRRSWSRAPEHVIPNGIPIPAAPPTAAERHDARETVGLATEDVVIGIVARLSPPKAHEVLLAATARLVGTRPHLRLVVVGGGPREAELRERATALGLDAHVVFTGARRDVGHLLAAFDVATLCSRWEAAPLAVLEALAAGLPVVTTDCGALPDLVADGVEGFVVPVDDDAALAERLARLVDDPELRARYGDAARRRAEKEFTAERMARSYEDLLDELTGTRR